MILDVILSSNDTAQDRGYVTAQDRGYVTAQDRGYVTAQVNVHAHQEMSDQVQRLVSVMKQEDYTFTELMQLVGLTHRATFQKNYLNPAIEASLIKRTIPDKPKSPKQKYRLK